MTNWSLQSRLRALLWAFPVLLLFGILAAWAAHGPQWPMLIFLLAGIALATWGQAMIRTWLAPITKLDALVGEISQGRFSGRITGVTEMPWTTIEAATMTTVNPARLCANAILMFS